MEKIKCKCGKEMEGKIKIQEFNFSYMEGSFKAYGIICSECNDPIYYNDVWIRRKNMGLEVYNGFKS